jgi:ubiquinone/menaquinone biosynthesis C-methylase UbiE
MTLLWLVLAGIGMALLVGLVYWQLIVAEGAYLGPRVVAWTYNLVASRYDAIKRFDPRDENWFVAGPLLAELGNVQCPLVLDVATGTGRLPLALLRARFRGQIVGLDLSQEMLRQARSKLRPYDDQVHWIWQDASQLPFEDGVFEAVTCLESLEFLPHPLESLAEMVRVLAPGGVLFVSNRVGREAHWLPGRAIPRPLFEQALASHSLRDVAVRPWQSNYDLAVAHKEGCLGATGRREADLASLLCCPRCGGQVQRGLTWYSCQACEQTYPIRAGVICLASSSQPG